ncbi:MAG: ATP-binding protein [Chloroflexi bacterium]|nr:ATP-binding protein [Chloroflexota bacterium]
MNVFRNNLVVQFSVVSFVVMATVAVILVIVLSNNIRSGAVNDLVDEAVGSSSARLLGVLTPEDLDVPMTGERYDRFHEFVQSSIVSDRTARIKLWAGDGTVIYSTDPSQVGEQFPTKENLLKALQDGNGIEIKVPEDPENELDRHLGTLMEVYTPIVFPGTTTPAGSFEIYQYYGPTAARIDSMRRWLFGAIGLGFGTLYLGLVFIVWGGWRTINRQQTQLETFNSELEAMVKDRTEELERAHEQLLDSQRLAAIGELAGGVAHELRSPLSAIMNAVYYIKGKLVDNGGSNGNNKVKEFLNVMDYEIEHSNEIITSMMDYARMPTHESEPVNIQELVDESMTNSNYNGAIMVSKEFDENLPAVSLDRAMVSKALRAMIENARESMPNGGTLKITAKQSGGYLVMDIKDSGHGIAPSELTKVFDPMFSTRNRGVGLGLPIAHQVMRWHGGSLEIVSAPGSGTTVTITLPLSEQTVSV